jgi:predicted AAA+ superfamily ATPase
MGRVIDSFIKKRLNSAGAIQIEGSKGCGKTRTAKEFSNSAFYLIDPNNLGNLEMARSYPAEVLKGEVPRLIDEWQFAPILWDAVRFTVDERGKKGQFILTGSSVPQEDGYHHTGTGRISRILMRPMSLYESGESDGSVSVEALFNGDVIRLSESKLQISDIAKLIARGGWPSPIIDGTYDPDYARDYVESIANNEVSRADRVKRDPETVKRVMRSISRNISTLATTETITEDVAGDGRSISKKMVQQYIRALTRIFVVEDVPAWNASTRSKVAIRTSPKRQMADPSLAAAVLGLDAAGIMKDFRTFGFLFESLCIRDLRVYSQVLGGEINHYRDRYDLEADAVIRLTDGRWAAVEVKLGVADVDNAAKNLLKLRERIDEEKMNSPSFLMVLTGTGYAYQRDDGVLVVPIGCLGP